MEFNFHLYIIWSVLLLIPAWKVCQKAGFTPWWSLLVFVPLLGYPALCALLGWGQWPARSRG
jgi:hypothetical protein